MKQAIIAFSLKAFFAMVIILIFHYWAVYNYIEKAILFKSYLINFLLVLIAYILLWSFKKKHNLLIIFSLTIIIKFLVYFIYFYPVFYQDSILEHKEFMIFFIPYFIGLIIEIDSFKTLI
tara:strand:- start:13169 stop:13528 length:360 start_codon:yes stop_codon:yes gene_type:complete